MKPILFNQEMVLAILDGRKSVTRRAVKQKGWEITGRPAWGNQDADGRFWFSVANNNTATVIPINPPYHPGEIMYVRETWSEYNGVYIYKTHCRNKKILEEVGNVKISWRPSIHMPKEAARIFLRVTGVRAERLQDIKNDQTVDEGAVKRPNYTKRGYLVLHNRYREEFAKLWDSTVKKSDLPRYGWDASPWVWVIAFERISKEEAMKGCGEK